MKCVRCNKEFVESQDNKVIIRSRLMSALNIELKASLCNDCINEIKLIDKLKKQKELKNG